MTKQQILDEIHQLVNNAPEWLLTPNPAFNGKIPLYMLESGDLKPLEHMIYVIKSGMPG